MSKGQETNVSHGLAEARLYNAIAHADNQEEEERERVATGIEYSDNYHHDFRDSIVSVGI